MGTQMLKSKVLFALTPRTRRERRAAVRVLDFMVLAGACLYAAGIFVVDSVVVGTLGFLLLCGWFRGMYAMLASYAAQNNGMRNRIRPRHIAMMGYIAGLLQAGIFAHAYVTVF